jgi:cytochrome P450
MDLAQKVQYLTLDVISHVGLGQPFEMLKADSDLYGYIKSAEEGLTIANASVGLGINWIIQIPWIGRLLGPSERDASGFGKMMETAFKMVDNRLLSSTTSRSDILASFIRHGLTQDELRSEALEQILAGSDTTATGIRGILLHLMLDSRVYKTLQDEIDQVAKDEISSSSTGVVPNATARQMTYLQGVIREGLRMFPPVVNIFSKDVPPEGDTVTINGESVFIPGGTNIGYAALEMHQSEATYGKDAAVFKPERWLIENEEQLAKMKTVNDLIFGYGKWQCLGKNIALIEIGKIIFEVRSYAYITT